MGNSRTAIEAQLNLLRVMTSSDFSALAWIDKRGQHIRWKYASGNINDRYKQMSGRPGRGLAGSVVRYGRLKVLDETDHDACSRRLEYPIMLAENLHAAAAVPVTVNGETRGVLLAGSRSSRKYTQNEIELILGAAEQIALLQKEEQNHEC